jgi:hypothetical protein
VCFSVSSVSSVVHGFGRVEDGVTYDKSQKVPRQFGCHIDWNKSDGMARKPERR